MKIMSSTNIPDAFQDFEAEAYHAGYDMSMDGDLNIKLTPTEDNMPKITLQKLTERGVIYYNPSIEFPNLVHDEYQYADYIEGEINRWDKVGRLCTYIVKFYYNPVEWEDE